MKNKNKKILAITTMLVLSTLVLPMISTADLTLQPVSPGSKIDGYGQVPRSISLFETDDGGHFEVALGATVSVTIQIEDEDAEDVEIVGYDEEILEFVSKDIWQSSGRLPSTTGSYACWLDDEWFCTIVFKTIGLGESDISLQHVDYDYGDITPFEVSITVE